ncbi:dienelactone hydrolase family protein [Hydrocarboniphaga sp.]|uniref:dienelactone hydrolase family protein n=1 Tax=Hydrocarboniphaga sp. TaxID=2033016 RepID=UPI003D11936F
MKSRKIEYRVGDTVLVGYLAWDDARSGPRPGVLVFPEAFGLNEHARLRADRLAQLGYVAFAADLHGQGKVYPDLPSVMPAIKALYGDREQWRQRARSAFDTLIAQPEVDAQRTAAIGFCFGGATCFELARIGAPLAAIATFHAGILPEQAGDAGRMQARVLICNGADDPVVKKDALEAVTAELRRDRLDWQLIQYGSASHSFTDPTADQRGMPGFGYNALAEARSWATMRALFEDAFQR